MATKYLRSTDGADVDNGTTWALAKATLSGANGVLAAGDTLYVSDNHSESSGAGISVTLAGTATSPVRIICGDDAAEPPTALSTAGAIQTTGGNFAISIHGSCYVYGLTLTAEAAGSAANAATINLMQTSVAHRQEWVNCKFRLGSTSANIVIAIGTGSHAIANAMTWRGCTVRGGHAGQGIMLLGGAFHWDGGGIESGGTNPTALFYEDFTSTYLARPTNVLAQNLDLSSASTALDLVYSAQPGSVFMFRNILLPTSWAGDLSNQTPGVGVRIEMYNYKIGSTVYTLKIEDHTGKIDEELTLVKSGETLSYKTVSNANALYPQQPLRSGEIAVPITGADVGVSKTITVDILHDSVTNLKDDEVWLEVVYPTTSPTGTYKDDKPTDILTANADQTASAVTWTTTGMANPNKQKLAVTFTPNRVGVAMCRVALAKASKTIYVSPEAVKS